MISRSLRYILIYFPCVGARLAVSPPASSMTAATPHLPHAAQLCSLWAAGFPLGPEGKLQALNVGRQQPKSTTKQNRKKAGGTPH